MSAASGALLLAYFSLLGGLALLGVHRLYISILYLRRRRKSPGKPEEPPPVTVQLPVYNEIYVLERLVAAACALRYPRHLLEIQILDDSTDGTAERASELAGAWRARGFDVTCLHRDHRAGFKSGALAEGLERARGDLIAVFDADFIPPPEFLERTLPWFADQKVGMVQARWGHLNRNHSTLTRAQALMLDAHFVVEQSARSSSGRFFNFNGTAGIFRRRCIEEAGGWQPDTLTEDLDLSYRAQMAGWKFIFVDDLICPAELPVEMNSLRSQQHRWAKGSLQTAFKLLPRLLRSPLSLRVKSEAVFHLTNNTAYLLLFLVSVLMIPALMVRLELGWRSALVDLLVFLAGTCSFGFYCAVSQREQRHGILRALVDVPMAMALGAGLALNNALAVVEALRGVRSEFIRTPKFRVMDGAAPSRRSWQALGYRGNRTRLAPVELALAVIFAGAMGWAWTEGLYASIPFLALFGGGYGYVSILTFAQDLGGRLQRLPRLPSFQQGA
jgi:cellulose synthase/poly-beta-1,6-N-acetylglucosamine synthase-like glycosyltransferase